MSQRNKRKERSSPESQTQPPPSPTHDPHIPSSSSSCSSAAYNFPYHPLLRPPPSTTHDAYIPSSPPSCSSAATNFPSDPRMNPIVLPPLPGFKFLPDDEDLILLLLYLKPFVEGNKNSPPNVPVHHVDVYDSNPDQLSSLFPSISQLFVHRIGFIFWFLICENGYVLLIRTRGIRKG